MPGLIHPTLTHSVSVSVVGVVVSLQNKRTRFRHHITQNVTSSNVISPVFPHSSWLHTHTRVGDVGIRQITSLASVHCIKIDSPLTFRNASELPPASKCSCICVFAFLLMLPYLLNVSPLLQFSVYICTATPVASPLHLFLRPNQATKYCLT